MMTAVIIIKKVKGLESFACWPCSRWYEKCFARSSWALTVSLWQGQYGLPCAGEETERELSCHHTVAGGCWSGALGTTSSPGGSWARFYLFFENSHMYTIYFDIKPSNFPRCLLLNPPLNFTFSLYSPLSPVMMSLYARVQDHPVVNEHLNRLSLPQLCSVPKSSSARVQWAPFPSMLDFWLGWSCAGYSSCMQWHWFIQEMLFLNIPPKLSLLQPFYPVFCSVPWNTY